MTASSSATAQLPFYIISIPYIVLYIKHISSDETNGRNLDIALIIHKCYKTHLYGNITSFTNVSGAYTSEPPLKGREKGGRDSGEGRSKGIIRFGSRQLWKVTLGIGGMCISLLATVCTEPIWWLGEITKEWRLQDSPPNPTEGASSRVANIFSVVKSTNRPTDLTGHNRPQWPRDIL